MTTPAGAKHEGASRMRLDGYFERLARWKIWEILFWLALAGAYFVPGVNIILLGQIFIWGLFAMSLDILLGYRGIPSLGHAGFFGIGM